MSALVQAWSGLPRVVRWLALALLVVAAYFLAVEPALNVAARYRTSAERIAGALQREKDLASPDSDDGKLLAQADRIFGKPLLPTDPNARAETLVRTVYRILGNHLVDDAVVNESNATLQLPPEQLLTISGGRPIERYTLQVSFEADPQTAAAVLADMESAPEITAVSRVRVEKVNFRTGWSATDDEDRMLRVMFAPEIWAVAGAGSGSGGGGGQ